MSLNMCHRSVFLRFVLSHKQIYTSNVLNNSLYISTFARKVSTIDNIHFIFILRRYIYILYSKNIYFNKFCTYINQKSTAYLIILQILHKKYISVQKHFLLHLLQVSSTWYPDVVKWNDIKLNAVIHLFSWETILQMLKEKRYCSKPKGRQNVD